MPCKGLSLTDLQRDGLLCLYRTTDDANIRSRCQMILLLADGYCAEQVSAMTYFDHNTVLLWRRRFENQDWEGLLDRPRSGRPSKSYSLRTHSKIKESFWVTVSNPSA